MRRALLCAVLLLLAGCGGGADDSAAGEPSEPSTASSSTAESTAAESSAAPTEPADDENPVRAKDLCAFLSKDLTRLQAVGSPIGALAQFAVGFAGWVEEHPEQKPRTAADLDEAAQGSCPAVRTSVLTTLGADSFVDALG
jgi:hypothetical protein